MLTNIAKCVLALAIVFTLQATASAAEQPVSIGATVPAISMAVEVKISSLDSVDPLDPKKDWATREDAGTINFGDLVRNTDNKILMAKKYYAVDVSVADNTGKNWAMAHLPSHIVMRDANGLTSSLDDSITVSFAKMKKGVDTTTGKAVETEQPISSKRYGKSATLFMRDQLEGNKGGWLRIYYGVATGNTDPTVGAVDPPGAVPIPQYQAAGEYSGGITLVFVSAR